MTVFVRGSLFVLGIGVIAGLSTGCGRTESAAVPSTMPTLVQTSYLKASNTGEGDQFGAAVAISGDGSTLAVGAPAEDGAATGVNGNDANDDAYDAGAVYVFTRNGDGWSRQAYLKASNAEQLDQFGTVVALSDDGSTLVVGAHQEDGGAPGVNGDQADNSVGAAGAAYVFVRQGTSWSQQAYLKASNPGEAEDGDTFAFSIAVSGDGNTVAAGAPSEDSNAGGQDGNQADNSSPGAGAVYVFTRSGGAWSQDAYLKSDAPAEFAAGDLFGYSVALTASGDRLAVGVYDEGTSGNTVNAPFDNKLNGSGGVYVYTRNGSMWTREALLKARQQDRNDSLGASLAISDDGSVVAVGAPDEDSLTSGIDAVEPGHSGETDAPDDNSAGAVYVFTRDGSTWAQQAALKASNTDRNDWFGIRLALSGDGDTLVVGASNEDSSATGIDGNQADNAATEAGAAYLFRRAGTSWAQGAYVKGSNTEEFDEFASAVALDGDGSVLAVGAKFEDSAATGVNGHQADDTALDAGAVYVFTVGGEAESE